MECNQALSLIQFIPRGTLVVALAGYLLTAPSSLLSNTYINLIVARANTY